MRSVLHFYGENNSLPTENLENLLHLLTSRRAASVDSDANPLRNVEVMMHLRTCCDLFRFFVLFKILTHLLPYHKYCSFKLVIV